MKDKYTIIVGTRKSLLAMTQTQIIINELKVLFPEYKFLVKKIITTGDRLKKWPQNQAKGFFVKEIEQALLSKKIDFAVHSMKDLPVDSTKGLEITAIPKRQKSNDVLISRSKKSLKKLKKSCLIGTSSPRRKAQLMCYRPDLKVKDIRGNLDTRIKKIKAGEFDAIVVAAAGLIRLGWGHLAYESLSAKIMLPAPGQGALGIQARSNDLKTKKILKKIDHAKTRFEVTAEREFLKAMGGGCRVPIGALARINRGCLKLQAVVAEPSGVRVLRKNITVPGHQAKIAARKLAERFKGVFEKVKV